MARGPERAEARGEVAREQRIDDVAISREAEDRLLRESDDERRQTASERPEPRELPERAAPDPAARVTAERAEARADAQRTVEERRAGEGGLANPERRAAAARLGAAEQPAPDPGLPPVDPVLGTEPSVVQERSAAIAERRVAELGGVPRGVRGSEEQRAADRATGERRADGSANRESLAARGAEQRLGDRLDERRAATRASGTGDRVDGVRSERPPAPDVYRPSVEVSTVGQDAQVLREAAAQLRIAAARELERPDGVLGPERQGGLDLSRLATRTSIDGKSDTGIQVENLLEELDGKPDAPEAFPTDEFTD